MERVPVAERPENPFVFGEIVDPRNFVDREQELDDLVRDLADGQKVFLLSPRRFGKSSLVSMAMLRLQKQHVRTATIPVSSYATYGQFLEKFAEKVLQAAGPWERVKDWVGRFFRRAQPEAAFNVGTGEVNVSLGRRGDEDPSPLAPEVFALPGELAKNGGFRMAICLDEFQKIQDFNGGTVENALRNEVQKQRQVGYVFAGSQPTLMEQMLSPKRPFHKSGPRVFLQKIPDSAWRSFISRQFRNRGRQVNDDAIDTLLSAADMIPYDVQRLAHELWDQAELRNRAKLTSEDVREVLERLVRGQATYYERLWQQLAPRQRALLQALCSSSSDHLLSEEVRLAYRLGPASSAQRALQGLMAQDIVDRYGGRYFFLDPIFGQWVARAAR